MICRNCGHPFSDHVTMVMNAEIPVVSVCYFPVHRNYDCGCEKYEREMNAE